jgi:hypothetical protein
MSTGAALWLAMARFPLASVIWSAILCRKTITVAAAIASNTAVPSTIVFVVLVHVTNLMVLLRGFQFLSVRLGMTDEFALEICQRQSVFASCCVHI